MRDIISLNSIYGLLLAGGIATAAWRFGVLSPGGAVAAVILGVASVSAGWPWAWLLVAFFVASSGVSMLSAARKAERAASVVAKSGRRDAIQVLANGGIFVAAALAARISHSEIWAAAAIGALAAAAADTWGTEIGMLSAGDPWMVNKWQQVPAGTSGAVSSIGVIATVGGAVFVAVTARLLGWHSSIVVAAATGGIVGAFADTMLGAVVQARWACPQCGTMTERRVHSCGAVTQLKRGPAWIDNDMVNFISSGTGAIAAVLLIS